MEKMVKKHVLLMYISNVSGHRCASTALETALSRLDSTVSVKAIDAFNYTNPFWEKRINSLYMLVIKGWPWLWDYLYDNRKVLNRAEKIRPWIHQLNERKMKALLEQFTPDVVVCTQAFPLGMVADYKFKHRLALPIVGVLTDFAPHSYWLNDYVNAYVVPAPQIRQRLIEKGIATARLATLGIPIDPKFAEPSSKSITLAKLNLDPKIPVVLVMGGGQGLGPLKDIVRALDTLQTNLQLVVVCGTNKKLFTWFNKNKHRFTKPLTIFGYSEQINELMDIASFIVTKPGGLTSAEALSKSLPIVIFSPLPGQESQNSQFLLNQGAAIKVNKLEQLKTVASNLLTNPLQLQQLRQKAQAIAYPDSAVQIAQLILNMVEKNAVPSV